MIWLRYLIITIHLFNQDFIYQQGSTKLPFYSTPYNTSTTLALQRVLSSAKGAAFCNSMHLVNGLKGWNYTIRSIIYCQCYGTVSFTKFSEAY